MKMFILVLALTAFLYSLMTPALCISVSVSGGTGGGSVSTSTNYNLDDSTRLQEQTVLSESQMVQSREATGSGNNLIDQSVGGNGYSVNNVIDSSGSFSTSASTAASSTSASLSQSLVGSGDLSTSIDGVTASGSSGQISEVTGGALSTTQTLAAASGVYAGQNTQLSGQTGGIGSSSFSAGNEINVAGGFSGEGDLVADLLAMATDRSFVDGDASFLGISVLGDETMQTLNLGDMGYSVDGVYEAPGGSLGTFGLSATNYPDGNIGSDTSSLLSAPAVTSTGGNSNAYWLSGKKWTQLNPQVKMSVNAAGSGLTGAQMRGAVSAAAETWDAATNQNLFSDGGAVDTTAVQGKYDKQNVVSFLKYNPGCTALASAGTWYRLTKVGGYYPIVESDIAFNSNYKWTTTGASGAYDFQSVALHEMGHTIGLGDLYNKAIFSKDSRQVMHYYTGVKRTLGNGDSTGVWKLYG